MRKITKVLIVILLLGLTNIVQGTTISDKSVNKIITLSGIDKELSEHPNLAMAGIKQAIQQGLKVEKEHLADIQKIVLKVFDPSGYLSKMRASLVKNITEEEAQKIVSWYESDLGRKITKAEVDATTIESIQKMQSEAEKLFENKELIKASMKINQLTKVTDSMMYVQMQASLGIYTIVSAIDKNSQKVDPKDFKAFMLKQKKAIRIQLEKVALLASAYRYKNINKENLNQYIQFTESAPAQKMIVCLSDCLNKSMCKSYETIGRLVADMYEKIHNIKK